MERKRHRVVVDSNVWVEFYSGKRTSVTEELKSLIKQDRVVMVGPVLYEVLVGPRTEGQRQYLLGHMKAFPMLPANANLWLHAVKLRLIPDVAIRRVPATDVFITAYCEIFDCSLFTRDPHFEVFPDLKRHMI